MIKVKADSNININKLMKDVKKQALDEMKKRVTREINIIARGTGEHPRIKFICKGDANIEVKVEGVSDNLKSKIDSWLKKQN